MLGRKILGKILSVGDKILIYRVAETIPSGLARGLPLFALLKNISKSRKNIGS